MANTVTTYHQNLPRTRAQACGFPANQDVNSWKSAPYNLGRFWLRSFLGRGKISIGFSRTSDLEKQCLILSSGAAKCPPKGLLMELFIVAHIKLDYTQCKLSFSLATTKSVVSRGHIQLVRLPKKTSDF